MDSDPPLSPAVAGRDIAVGISGKSSPVGAVAGGGDEICKNGQSGAVGVECLLDPSVPVAATEDKITVSTAVAGDGPNVGSGCGLYVGDGAGISSDGSNGHSSTDCAVIESGNLERGAGFESLVDPDDSANLDAIHLTSPRFCRLQFGMLDGTTGNLEEDTGIRFGFPISVGGTPVLPPVNERGLTALTHRLLGAIRAIGLTPVLNSMGGTPVLPLVYVEGEGGRSRRLHPGIDFASLPISVGATSVLLE